MRDEATDQHDLYGEYAGFVTRLVGFVSDLLVIIAVVVGISIVAELLRNFFTFNSMTNWLLNVWVAASSFLVLQFYFIGFWMLAGQTPGMYLMGLRVVRVDGGRVTIGVAVRRIIGYYISMLLFLGFLWVLWDDRRQGWFDKLAGTYVIYAWSFDKELERARPLRRQAARLRR